MERSPRRALDGAWQIVLGGPDKYLPQMNEADLHVWTFSLEVDRESIALQEAVLSAEEWRRVRRYSSPHAARRFIVRRGLLRRILGKYLDHPPEEVRFVYNAYGKPFLAPEKCFDLQFSLSDSGELGALAVGLKDPVGIDIEFFQADKDIGGTCLFGSPTENADHYEGPTCPTYSFPCVRAWTRREAVAKADGVGLQMLIGQSEMVGLAEYMSPTSAAGGPNFGRGIGVHDLTLPAGYVGSLAAVPRTPEINYFSL